MEDEPRIDERDAQPYLGLANEVADEAAFRRACDRGFPELFAWIERAGVELVGAPFLRYLEIDGDDLPRRFEIAAPVAGDVAGEGRIEAGVLPEGRYATLLHTGPYTSADVPDLDAARSRLLSWIESREIELASAPTERGVWLSGAIDRFVVDPIAEPDPARWQTEIAYLVT